MPADATTSVIVVGGGPVGLAASIYLSLRNIPHLLFERYPGTSIHPKAVGFNPRSTEIFRELGVEDEILRQRAPPEKSGHTAWYTAVGPSGKEIYKRETWCGLKAEYDRASPAEYFLLPQIRLEPILKARALELNPQGLNFSAEVVDLQETDESVLVRVQHVGQEGQREYRAQYVIGADGGRFLAAKLDIPIEGPRDVLNMVSCHVRAPITQFHDPEVFISWLINPALGGTIGTGYLYHLGPWPHNPETEEWMFAFGTRPDDPDRFDKNKAISRLKLSLGLPDLNVELLSISQWRVDAIVAQKYRSAGRRVFLVGDAAHRVPPWGALGLNTGLQDLQNLIWKLMLALKGDGGSKKYDALLDTYEEERKPIADRVAKKSLKNLLDHGLVMDKALSIDISNDAATNFEAMEAYFNEAHPEHQKLRQAVSGAQKVLDGEFRAVGAEVGWFYPSADLNGEGSGNRHDGALLDDGDMDTTNYHPSSIPGHQLPHAWLRKGDLTVSTRDLVRLDKLVLLVRDNDWAPGAPPQSVQVEVIDNDQGWHDVDGLWAQQCGVGEKGAVLVRPDRIVAWRTQEKEPSSLSEVVARLMKTTE